MVPGCTHKSVTWTCTIPVTNRVNERTEETRVSNNFVLSTCIVLYVIHCSNLCYILISSMYACTNII